MSKILYFFLFFSLSTSLFANSIDEGLKQISLNDKKLIKEFVELNLQWHSAAHVIYFENKPMCLASARIKAPDRQFMDVLWVKGWHAFKKNEHLFPHPNFIFNSEIQNDEDGWKSISLFIINKSALQKCLQEHLLAFQDVLGKEFSYDWFISKLDANQSVYEVIKNDEKLLGILLGYGEESASAYQYLQTMGQDDLMPKMEYGPNEAKLPKGCKLMPVVIMGNPYSTEVQSLLEQYEKELNEFWSVYQKKDSLRFFLDCICNDS